MCSMLTEKAKLLEIPYAQVLNIQAPSIENKNYCLGTSGSRV